MITKLNNRFVHRKPSYMSVWSVCLSVLLLLFFLFVFFLFFFFFCFVLFCFFTWAERLFKVISYILSLANQIGDAKTKDVREKQSGCPGAEHDSRVEEGLVNRELVYMRVVVHLFVFQPVCVSFCLFSLYLSLRTTKPTK